MTDKSNKPGKESSKSKTELVKEELKKTRLMLEEPVDSPLNHLQNLLKDRGVKSLDLNALVSEALLQISPEWWEQKAEELTPLKFKLDAALEDPKMREKLISLLEAKEAGQSASL